MWPQQLISPDGKTLYGDQKWVVIQAGTPNVSEIHLWKDRLYARVIIHEAMHAIGWMHWKIGTPEQVFDTPGGRSFSEWENICVPKP